MGNRNLLLLMLGRLVSDFGSSLFLVSIVWEAAANFGGARAVSLVLAAFSIPSILLAPIAGVCADRLNKKYLIVGSDLMSGAALILLGVGWHMGMRGFGWVVASVVAVQISGVFFRPALLALIPELADAQSLTQANAVVQFASTLANITGLAVGGVLVAILDLDTILILDGASFGLSAMSEGFIRYARPSLSRGVSQRFSISRMWSDIAEGFGLIWKPILLRGLILTDAAVNFVSCSIFVVLPLLVLGIGDGDPKGYGVLQACMAVGAVLAAAGMSLLQSVKRRFIVLALAVTTSGIAIALMGTWGNLPLLCVFMVYIGLASTVANVTETVLIQEMSPSTGRGRVFALRGALDSTLRPLAFWLFGAVAVLISVRALLVLVGVLVALSGGVYWLIGQHDRGRDSSNTAAPLER